jgi:hypothetical protein
MLGFEGHDQGLKLRSPSIPLNESNEIMISFKFPVRRLLAHEMTIDKVVG